MTDHLNTAKRVLAFEQLFLRCDKSDSEVINQLPWNWSIHAGERLAVMTNNSFLSYQLIAILCDFVKPVAGDFIVNGSLSWPLAGHGGLDSKMTIRAGFEFVSIVYSDCLEHSLISIDEFFNALNLQGIDLSVRIADLAEEQKDFFFAALSILFRFDVYVAPHSKYLMSKKGGFLRGLLHKQLSSGLCMISTANNDKFRREFCNSGIVLGPLGEVLFHGDLEKAIEYGKSIDVNSNSGDDDVEFDFSRNLTNSEQDLNSDFDDDL